MSKFNRYKLYVNQGKMQVCHLISDKLARGCTGGATCECRRAREGRGGHAVLTVHGGCWVHGGKEAV
jgi:acetyl esterase/lipase